MPPADAARAAQAGIAASAGTISLATAASRILGFVRDLVIAKLFGAGVQAQAFVVAFRLPNLFRDLVAEGAMTTAVVPVLSAYRATKPPQEFWRLTHALFIKVTLTVTVLGGLGVVVAPWLVTLMAPGFAGDPEKMALTIQLTRVLFPFIALVGIWAFFCGLLNSLHQFALPALGPAVLNLIMIAGCLWAAPHLHPGVIGLAWAAMLGGVVQVAMLVPPAVARGFRWHWVWRHPTTCRVAGGDPLATQPTGTASQSSSRWWDHEGSREVMRLLAPRLVGTAVYQISVLFDTVLASLGALAGEGAIVALYLANRLVQLPLALFATASAQASLPTLSEQAATKDLHKFHATVAHLLRLVAFESLPAAVGLVVLALPIVRLCFERGAFDRSATLMTARTLSCLSIGLMAYAAGKVLSGAFYALHDTRTPVRLAMQALLVNVGLAVMLIGPLRIGGVALATALSNSVNAWRLLKALERRLGLPLVHSLVGPFWRMGLAALLMGLWCWAVWMGWGTRMTPLGGLLLVIVSGMLIYGVICRLLGVAELSMALRWLASPFLRFSSSV